MKPFRGEAMDENTNKIEQRKAFLINLLFFGAVIAIIMIIFRYVIGWLLPFIIGFIIAAIMHPIIRRISKRTKVRQKYIAVIVVVLGYALIVTLLTLGVIQLMSQLSVWLVRLPDYFTSQVLPTINNLGDSLSGYIDNMPPEWQRQLEILQSSLITTLSDTVASLSSYGLTMLGNFTKALPSFFIALIFTILASFFISMQYDQVKEFLSYQMSDKVRHIVREVKNTFSGTIFKYFKAYLKIMTLTFVELSVALLVLRVNNAIPIALGIAIFDILPVFGTGGILIPWILISLLNGEFVFALGLLIVYVIVTIVRNFAEPKIIGDQLGLNPIVSLIAIYLGFKWIGVFGMILMPVSVQIALTLHRRGVITLYKRKSHDEPVDNEEGRREEPNLPKSGKRSDKEG